MEGAKVVIVMHSRQNTAKVQRVSYSMWLEHRCEQRLPNDEAEELITRQIMKTLACSTERFGLDS